MEFDPSAVAAAFMQYAARASATAEILTVPTWQESQWTALLSYTQPVELLAGAVLIQPRVVDRALYLVASGRLEVASTNETGGSLGPLNEIPSGSVVGELSFFDGRPRSAKVWAVTACRLLKFSLADYECYVQSRASDVPEFLFALARLLAVRLRNTTARL